MITSSALSLVLFLFNVAAHPELCPEGGSCPDVDGEPNLQLLQLGLSIQSGDAESDGSNVEKHQGQQDQLLEHARKRADEASEASEDEPLEHAQKRPQKLVRPRTYCDFDFSASEEIIVPKSCIGQGVCNICKLRCDQGLRGKGHGFNCTSLGWNFDSCANYAAWPMGSMPLHVNNRRRSNSCFATDWHDISKMKARKQKKKKMKPPELGFGGRRGNGGILDMCSCLHKFMKACQEGNCMQSQLCSCNGVCREWKEEFGCDMSQSSSSSQAKAGADASVSTGSADAYANESASTDNDTGAAASSTMLLTQRSTTKLKALEGSGVDGAATIKCGGER